MSSNSAKLNPTSLQIGLKLLRALFYFSCVFVPSHIIRVLSTSSFHFLFIFLPFIQTKIISSYIDIDSIKTLCIHCLLICSVYLYQYFYLCLLLYHSFSSSTHTHTHIPTSASVSFSFICLIESLDPRVVI